MTRGYSITAYDPNTDSFQGRGSATDTSDTLLKAAPGLNKKNAVTAVVIYNAHATTGTGVYLKSGSTIIWGPIPAPGGKGGAIVPLPNPVFCNENEALNFATLDSVATVYVSVVGFISPK